MLATTGSIIHRAHRIGLQRPVQVHRIFTEGTVEDKILALQEKKRAMTKSALDKSAGWEVGSPEKDMMLRYSWLICRAGEPPVSLDSESGQPTSLIELDYGYAALPPSNTCRSSWHV